MSLHAVSAVSVGPRTPATLAGRIEADIARDGWNVGAVLGSESELMERYGVSRAALREAARLLEYRDVASMRRGPNGGLVVGRPDASAVTSSAVVYLEYVGTTLENVLEARCLLEPAIAGLAARKIDEVGITELRSVLAEEVRRVEHDHSALNADLMHVCLGRLSGNPALAILVETLVRLTYRYARGSERNRAESLEVAGAVETAHRHIAAAVVAGDIGLAHHRAAQHIEAIAAYFASRPTPRRRRPRRLWLGEGGSSRLAPRVAEQIRADIEAAGWPVGEVVASETALLERHDVGRAVLREALRILEHHSVARMRRGQGGGLVVLAPDRHAAAVAMSSYLVFRKVSPLDLHRARALLEVTAFDLLSRRAGSMPVAERFGELTEDDGDRLHEALWRGDGNPVFGLFAEIFARDASRNSGSSCDRAAHAPIVTALRSGDLPLARHRLQRHLIALAPGRGSPTAAPPAQKGDR